MVGNDNFGGSMPSGGSLRLKVEFMDIPCIITKGYHKPLNLGHPCDFVQNVNLWNYIDILLL